MTVGGSAAPPGPRPRGRVLTGPDGEPRVAVVLALMAFALVALAIGMFAALLAAGLGSPETLAIWMVTGLLLIKIPMLAITWWIIARRRDPPEGGGWASEECARILAYIEEQALASVGTPGQGRRLAYFANEARYVAANAAPGDVAAAAELADRLERLAAGGAAGPER